MLAAKAVAAETITYGVFDGAGARSGQQVVTHGEGDATRVEFTFKENGRGPELKEEFVLASDGSFATYRVQGASEFGARVAESFSRNGEHVRWVTAFDSGDGPAPAGAFYAPLGGTPAILSAAIGALALRSDAKLPLIPNGSLSMRKVAELTVAGSRGKREVQLLALDGIGFMPTFVWTTTGARPRLFALIVPAGFQLVEDGWQSELAALKARQEQAQRADVLTMHERLVHRLPGATLIRNARVFDAQSAALLGASDVLLRDGRIVSVVRTGDMPEADNIVEAGGRVLLPGMFDMHSHVLPWEEGALHLAAGVTTMRDMGSDNATLRRLVEDERAGRILWPHVVSAGLIEGEGPMAISKGILITTLTQAKAAVDWYAERGYPQIKIYNSFPKMLVRETAAYAHSRGMRVSGHVPAFMRAREAVEHGFDEIQHINQVMLNFLVDETTDTRTLARFSLPADKTADLDFDSQPVRDFIALLAERGTVLDPTLATFEFLHQRNGEMWPVVADFADHLPPSVQRSRRAAEMDIPDDAAGARYTRSFEKMIEFVGRAYRAGVPLVAGTDELAGFTLQRELQLYVRGGLTPAQALQVATWNGAKYARVLEDRGSVTVGKRADLILLDADPTVDIANVRKVALVLKDGNAYYPSEIHRALNIKPFTEPLLVTSRKARQ